MFDREHEGSLEQVWLCPDLPPARDRSSLPVGVEVYCWFADTARLNESLLALWEMFGRDSVLVAIRRRNDVSRMLVYTAAREAVVHTRYYAVRGTLRPTAMGLRVVEEPGRDALGELLSSLDESPKGRGRKASGS